MASPSSYALAWGSIANGANALGGHHHHYLLVFDSDKISIHTRKKYNVIHHGVQENETLRLLGCL